jgi:hypothetical protein
MSDSVEVLSVKDIFKSKYIIPLYQRNFAWGEEQISQLLQDIYESIHNNDKKFFLGSLIVMQRPSGDFEVIDGQQRLSILSLLSIVLKMDVTPCLRYDSRPEVTSFFEKASGSDLADGNEVDNAISHFISAMDIIVSTQLDPRVIDSITLRNDSCKRQMSDYILQHVYLVREVMPDDTDVASYFEIMNNRGEQLKEHEIVKGLLLGKLSNNNQQDLSAICSKIWDSCSNMNERIQKSFAGASRISLFGDNYDELSLLGLPADANFAANNIPLLQQISIVGTIESPKSIDEIIADEAVANIDDNDANIEPSDVKEESIIDFPNFLMHVLRLFYNDIYKTQYSGKDEASDIPLNEKYLLNVYRAIESKIDPVTIFLQLLFCRTVFDRYIAKSSIEDDDEKRVWTLFMPKKQVYKDSKTGHEKSSLRFVPTFGDNTDQIVKAISCLQVSFRQRAYKNYLQSILSHFATAGFAIDAAVYKEFLHRLMSDEFNRISVGYYGLTSYDPSHQGTKVPHYLFNFVDYLYYIMQSRSLDLPEAVAAELSYVSNDFRFTNRNSIEHHYPRRRKEELKNENVTDFDLNCLGNLILIGKSANSRLSDKNPKDKASLLSDSTTLPPTRRIIYKTTLEKGWGAAEIQAHLQCVEWLINNRDVILSI